MFDRRTVLKLGAAGAAGALIDFPNQAIGAAATTLPPNSISRAVFDGRSPEAVTFAKELNRRGVTTSSIGNDIGKLWYGDLETRLREIPSPVAGLTDRATLFCLEELARSVGMRARYRVEHVIDPYGQVEHAVIGPAAIVAAVRRLAPGPGFGRDMAVLASQFDPRGSRETAAQKRTGPFSPEDKKVLVSWVIA
jgi:hypothetical protein